MLIPFISIVSRLGRMAATPQQSSGKFTSRQRTVTLPATVTVLAAASDPNRVYIGFEQLAGSATVIGMVSDISTGEGMNLEISGRWELNWHTNGGLVNGEFYARSVPGGFVVVTETFYRP